MSHPAALEAQLDAFDPAVRAQALAQLVEAGPAQPPAGSNVNMHFHSFFSYNARGYSPSHLAWESRKAGLYAAGLCDFDVLDGLTEFLDAGLALELRTTVNIETRAYLQEFAHAEINSPGEPGVTYIMGAGFTRVFPGTTPQGRTLAGLRQQAAQRNRALVRRINPHMGAAAIDYERDVVPLSPGGCPTERHIVRAYVAKAHAACATPETLAGFWAALLGKAPADLPGLLADQPAFEERVRAKLAKQGGLGYEAPTPQTFLPVDEFVAWVLACDAIPMATWLDGTSQGESDPAAMLECLRAKGAAAVNIIPDRNWNIRDAAVQAVKIGKLRAFVACATRLQMPINIGTEMNKDGLPFVDDLAGEALRPHRAAFLSGARIFVGHTWLLRYARFSYAGPQAAAEFGHDTGARNAFFEAVGKLPPLTHKLTARLAAAGPEKALGMIQDAAKQGNWPV